MENYSFEKFRSVGSRFNITISLGESERFYLGGSFCRKYNILDKAGVELMYDKNKNAVGFRFLDKNEDGMVNLKKLGKDSAYINAKAFLGIYDIEAKRFQGKYIPKEIPNNPDGKVFVIELSEHRVKA